MSRRLASSLLMAIMLATVATTRLARMVAARSSWRAAVRFTSRWSARIIIQPTVNRYIQTAMSHADSTRTRGFQCDGRKTPASAPTAIAALKWGRLRTM